jgi:DNA-binding response OmpR family regulator
MSAPVDKTFQNPRATRQPQARRKPIVRHHILLAEDDAEMRSMLSLALSQEGYSVIECRNGEELTLCLKESSSQASERVDLVISDIRMPGMSGLGVLATHGQKPKCPPIILMTAFGDPKTRSEAARMGAAAFFDKPFGLDELIRKVREIAPP